MENKMNLKFLKSWILLEKSGNLKINDCKRLYVSILNAMSKFEYWVNSDNITLSFSFFKSLSFGHISINEF